MEDAWADDRLGYREIGFTFTNLIKTIDTAKVIAIEAGFGRGKTFFRKRWAHHMRNASEVVIEVDVLQSDHFGDPVVTLLGALVEAAPKDDKKVSAKALGSAKKLAAIGARTVAKAAFKSGADELIGFATDQAIDALDNFDTLDDLLKRCGSEMSKAAGSLITKQMAAEKVRRKELPEQLRALQETLTTHSACDRVVVIVDELDRCHPDYAIAFLEAMKSVFSQSGFVFCLMVNADYLENLAQHRFGVAVNDERYLDKFVDIRLRLQPTGDYFRKAVEQLASELPLAIPFGDNVAFSLTKAASLAGTLAKDCQLSMRIVKRILLKIELAMRCYANQPLDPSLLVFLAFKDIAGDKVKKETLLRSEFTPEKAMYLSALSEKQISEFIHKNGNEFITLPIDRFMLPDDKDYYDWAMIVHFLMPYYVPFHRDVLNSVAEISDTSSL